MGANVKIGSPGSPWLKAKGAGTFFFFLVHCACFGAYKAKEGKDAQAELTDGHLA